MASHHADTSGSQQANNEPGGRVILEAGSHECQRDETSCDSHTNDVLSLSNAHNYHFQPLFDPRTARDWRQFADAIRCNLPCDITTIQ